MSSPFRPDRSGSTPRSSPARQHLSDSRSALTHGIQRANRSSLHFGSPSRPIWEEFERLYVNEEKQFRQALDASSAEQERKQKEALKEAHQRHEEVRQSAERARERLELEIMRERRRREEEEKRALEEARRKLAEQEAESKRRELEQAQRQEEERRRLEALQQQQDEHNRRVEAQKQQEAKERAEREAARQKEDAERKAREAAAARQAQEAQRPPAPIQQPVQQPQVNGTAAPAPPPPAVQPPPSAPQVQPQSANMAANAATRVVSSIEDREAVHRRYLELHSKLKKMRTEVYDYCSAQGRPVREALSNMRREITKIVGQLNKVKKEENMAKVSS
jgi:nucleoporin GLE1